MSAAPAVRLFVGSHAAYIQQEPARWDGDRCFTAAHPPAPTMITDPASVTALLDSGAFTDVGKVRLTPERALDRQLAWEGQAAGLWGAPWQSTYLASYDELIDEVWIPGQGKIKRRWSVRDADRAVAATVDAAAYLSSQRAALASRTLVLGCQGVDPVQYAECAAGVLAHAQPGDWIGLGGWCILGRFTSWLPTFWAALHLTLPQVAAAGIGHVHIYGCLHLRALGGLVWLADQYGLSVSADSARPIKDMIGQNTVKSGRRAGYWQDNIRWWMATLATLRHSRYYHPPPTEGRVQLSLLEDMA